MHDETLWAAWYLFLLAVPLFIVVSLVRETLSNRRIAIRQHTLRSAASTPK